MVCHYYSIDCWCLSPRRTRWSRSPRSSPKWDNTNSSSSRRCTASSTSSSTFTSSPSTIWAPTISSHSEKHSPIPNSSWERIKSSVSLSAKMKKHLTGHTHTELLLIWRDTALFSSPIAQGRSAGRFSTSLKNRNMRLVVRLLPRRSCSKRASILWNSSVTRWSRISDNLAYPPDSLTPK